MGEQTEAGRRAVWLHCLLLLFFFEGRGLAANIQLNLDGIERLLYRLLSSTSSRPAKSCMLRKRHLSDFSHAVLCIFSKQVMHLQLFFWAPQFLFCFMIPRARQTSAAQSVCVSQPQPGSWSRAKLLCWAALCRCGSSYQKGPDKDITGTLTLYHYVRGYVPPTQLFPLLLFCTDLTWRVTCTGVLKMKGL